ncbi:hypothetical protein BDK51DRAFT_38001 [Blyttiomyces helicus]|uniref:Uncharacterized protein n=1 Tax=Blyttiomyces helicus TaxID=388810 RepID=A0A4V1IQH0_9FUNG|nr:hypothetical protein BDK51DRAFT_38001 [Blyttiomyces helicus]|eukprot:RKO86527.1 hypothetical protein BDK51DRAFT_38001 [Blyttiomyces helicus]
MISGHGLERDDGGEEESRKANHGGAPACPPRRGRLSDVTVCAASPIIDGRGPVERPRRWELCLILLGCCEWSGSRGPRPTPTQTDSGTLFVSGVCRSRRVAPRREQPRIASLKRLLFATLLLPVLALPQTWAPDVVKLERRHLLPRQSTTPCLDTATVTGPSPNASNPFVTAGDGFEQGIQLDTSSAGAGVYLCEFTVSIGAGANPAAVARLDLFSGVTPLFDVVVGNATPFASALASPTIDQTLVFNLCNNPAAFLANGSRTILAVSLVSNPPVSLLFNEGQVGNLFGPDFSPFVALQAGMDFTLAASGTAPTCQASAASSVTTVTGSIVGSSTSASTATATASATAADTTTTITTSSTASATTTPSTTTTNTTTLPPATETTSDVSTTTSSSVSTITTAPPTETTPAFTSSTSTTTTAPATEALSTTTSSSFTPTTAPATETTALTSSSSTATMAPVTTTTVALSTSTTTTETTSALMSSSSTATTTPATESTFAFSTATSSSSTIKTAPATETTAALTSSSSTTTTAPLVVAQSSFLNGIGADHDDDEDYRRHHYDDRRNDYADNHHHHHHDYDILHNEHHVHHHPDHDHHDDCCHHSRGDHHLLLHHRDDRVLDHYHDNCCHHSSLLNDHCRDHYHLLHHHCGDLHDLLHHCGDHHHILHHRDDRILDDDHCDCHRNHSADRGNDHPVLADFNFAVDPHALGNSGDHDNGGAYHGDGDHRDSGARHNARGSDNAVSRVLRPRDRHATPVPMRASDRRRLPMHQHDAPATVFRARVRQMRASPVADGGAHPRVAEWPVSAWDRMRGGRGWVPADSGCRGLPGASGAVVWRPSDSTEIPVLGNCSSALPSTGCSQFKPSNIPEFSSCPAACDAIPGIGPGTSMKAGREVGHAKSGSMG